MIELNTNIPKGTKDWDKLINKNFKTISDNISNNYNPNLLINGDFQVWQRGEKFEIENNKYTADRWKTYFYSNISKSEHGLLIKGNKTEGSCGIEHVLEDYKFLLGKIVTLSIKAKVYKKVVIWISDTNDSIELEPNDNYSIYSKTFNIPSTLNKFRVILQNHSSEVAVGGEFIDIEYIKLELGSVATPFVPRSYGEELALCQRYYQTGRFGFAFGIGDNTFKGANMNFYNKMRTTPTITCSDELGNLNKWSYTKTDGNSENNMTNAGIINNNDIGFRAFIGYSSSYIGFSFIWSADAEIY